MVRGARIDLATAERFLNELWSVYERDVRQGELSDDAIAAVSKTIRSLEGALGKVAHGVGQKFVGPGCTPYFPIARDSSQFPGLLDRQFPGLASAHPVVAAAFARHQSYQEKHEPLGHLKALYRAHHHHDFTRQESVGTGSFGIGIPGFGELVGWHTGADPSGWDGILVSEHEERMGDSGFVYVSRRYADWFRKEPRVSVWGTLTRLHGLCGEICEDICATAGL